MSIGPDGDDFKTCLGGRPALGRSCRPGECPFCGDHRVWLDGVRVVYSLVLLDGTVLRFDGGLELQRAVCAACHKSWTIRPEQLYPHRSFEPDVVEAAGLEYLSEASETYAHVAKEYGCSARSVWRWVGWLASLLACAHSLSATAPDRPLPSEVPQNHSKARSTARKQLLLSALRALSALAAWARSRRLADARPLRSWLNEQLRTLGELHLQRASYQSPPLPEASAGPP